MKIAFFTVIFSMDEQYLIDFFESLQNQTFSKFDLLVLNDGYLNINSLISKYSKLNIIELKFSETPAKNREYGINFLIEKKYDIIIFGDSDDYFQSNRIEVCVQKLKKYDIVVNDFSLFKENEVFKKDYLSNRISNENEISLNFIKDKNIFGFTNTAINTRILENVNFNKNIIALDWYLFTTLLSNGNKAVFTNETKTLYRQHTNNIAGLVKTDSRSIKFGINVKLQHYDLLKNKIPEFTQNYLDIKFISKNLNNEYIEKIKKQNIYNPLWWESIKGNIL